MKRILFIINSMEIGGTRRSLLNLLSVMSLQENISCDLLMFSPYGDYIDEIPSNVQVIKSNYSLIAMFSSITSLRKRKQYFTILYKTIISVIKKFLGEKKVMKTIYKNHIKKLNNNYDLVIGFQEGGCNDYTSLTQGTKRVFWIHNNYENLTDLAHGFPESYLEADSINFVAKASMDSFKKAMPDFAKKMRVIKNVLPQELIKEYSLKECERVFCLDAIHLVSVGRVANQKGFDRLVDVAKKLDSNGFEFEWVIVGDGQDRELLMNKVKEYHLLNRVRFIGSKKNPYPYIRQADLYVMTSRYESQPMVLMESLTLGVPVLSTSFDSVNEIVQDRDFAALVDNSEEGIYDGLCRLLSCPSLIDKMRDNTRYFDYDNQSIINEILTL